MSQHLDNNKGRKPALSFLIKVAQFIFIPAASFILFSPSQLIGIVPGATPIVGILVLIVAALSLIGALMSGLNQALTVSFWAALWITVVIAFEADRMLPQPSKAMPTPTPTATLRPIDEIDRKLSESHLKKPQAPKAIPLPRKDGLDVISFDSKNRQTPTPTPKAGISDAINTAVGQVSKAAQDLPSPFDKDQSIDSLPKQAYFPSQQKKRFFGFGGGDDAGEGGSISSMFESFISFFTGKK